MDNRYFAKIADLELPEGTPVTGYKLVYHATDDNYYAFQNRNHFGIEADIRMPPDEVPERVREFTDRMSPENRSRFTYEGGLKEHRYVKDGPNVWHEPRNHEKYPHGYYYWKDKGNAEEWAEWAAPQMSHHMYGGKEGLPSGRFELLRVEGVHVKKTYNSEDIYNEGHVMNEMMFVDKIPLAAYDIFGKRVDETIPFQEWTKQSPAAHNERPDLGYYYPY